MPSRGRIYIQSIHLVQTRIPAPAKLGSPGSEVHIPALTPPAILSFAATTFQEEDMDADMRKPMPKPNFGDWDDPQENTTPPPHEGKGRSGQGGIEDLTPQPIPGIHHDYRTLMLARQTYSLRSWTPLTVDVLSPIWCVQPPRGSLPASFTAPLGSCRPLACQMPTCKLL